MTLALDRSGNGPPLVLLHPLGADRRVWDPVAGRLRAGGREVVAIDLPGFGGSPPLRRVTPTPAALAEAVAQELAAQGIERPDVAGNSLGGWVALELGLRERARSVCAVAPAGLWEKRLVPRAAFGHWAARALLPLIGPAAATGRGRSLLLSGSVAHPCRVPWRQAAHLVRAYALARGFTRVNQAMRAGCFTELERIPCPVTLVWPERDRLVRRPRRSPDGIRNVVLPDSGHIPMWDAPERVAQILLEATEPVTPADALRG